MGSRTWLRKHDVGAYLALTFLISWGGVLLLGAPHGMPTSQDEFNASWTVVFIPYLMGPLISGLVMTGVTHGKAGYKDLAARLLSWRVGPRYYAIALLTAPALILSVLLPLSLLSPSFTPALMASGDKLGVLAMGLGVGALRWRAPRGAGVDGVRHSASAAQAAAARHRRVSRTGVGRLARSPHVLGQRRRHRQV